MVSGSSFSAAPQSDRRTASAEAIALSAPDRQHLDDLLECLEFGDFPTRWDAVKRLPAFGRAALDGILDLLSDAEDEELCWFAARVLGQFDAPEAVAALTDLLASEFSDADVKALAAQTLAELGEPAIAPLTDLLNEPRWRSIAIRSLASIRTPAAIAPLFDHTDDADAAVRAEVLAVLATLPDPRVLSPLVRGLEDIAPVVRREATIGIGLRGDLSDDLGSVTLLERRLLDFDLGVCKQAAIALSRVGTADAVAVLGRSLRSPHTPNVLQQDIVRALSWIARPEAIDELATALSLPDAEICHEAVRALAKPRHPSLQEQAGDRLLSWFASGSPHLQHATVRQAIALALGNVPQAAAEDALRSLLHDEDDAVRWHAVAGCDRRSGQ